MLEEKLDETPPEEKIEDAKSAPPQSKVAAVGALLGSISAKVIVVQL